MRLKLLLKVHNGATTPLLGMDAKLIDMDSGQEVEDLGDLTLEMPMDGIAMVNAKILIHDVEVVRGEWPRFKVAG
jgi:hypothetical protein